MSWNMMKRIAQKKTKSALSVFQKEKERIDTDVPLNIRIGCGVNFDETNFVLAGDNSYVDSPGKSNTVVAISKSDILGFKVFRAYLTCDEEESVLQMIIDPETGDVAEATLYRTLDEIFPSNEDEWEEWIGEEGHIGSQAFFTPDDIGFDRLWNEGGPDHVEPETFTETIYADKYGENTIVVEHQAMLYARSVDIGEGEDLIEELIVSAEENEECAQVRIAAGLAMDVSEIEVI